MDFKDKIDIGFKIVGIIGGLIAAFKVIYELKESRKQKAKDLRWKQTNSARELINQMLSPGLAANATIMFDWTGREFEITANQKEAISFEDVRSSLRITDLEFTDKEVYIRDCVDAFLFEVEFMEQSINNQLIEFSDIKFPMGYFLKVLKKNQIFNPLKVFINEYQYTNSKAFFQRFGE